MAKMTASSQSRKMQNMNLLNYYKALPKPKPPKTDFIERMAERCGVEPHTVRLWVSGKCVPREDAHLDILAEETKIPKDQLFA